jgi:hypothetical protein
MPASPELTRFAVRVQNTYAAIRVTLSGLTGQLTASRTSSEESPGLVERDSSLLSFRSES